MPDQQPTPDPLAEVHEIERDILYLITDPDDNQPLWTAQDLEREMDQPGITDYLWRLHRSGLIHRTIDGHVFASRAAIRQIQIVGRVI